MGSIKQFPGMHNFFLNNSLYKNIFIYFYFFKYSQAYALLNEKVLRNLHKKLQIPIYI